MERYVTRINTWPRSCQALLLVLAITTYAWAALTFYTAGLVIGQNPEAQERWAKAGALGWAAAAIYTLKALQKIGVKDPKPRTTARE